MTSKLKDICTQVLEAAEKATPRPWQNEWNYCDWNFPYSHSIYRGEKDELPIQVQSLGRVLCVGKESPNVEASKFQCQRDSDFIVTAANNAQKLAQAVLILEDALNKIQQFDYIDTRDDDGNILYTIFPYDIAMDALSKAEDLMK